MKSVATRHDTTRREASTLRRFGVPNLRSACKSLTKLAGLTALLSVPHVAQAGALVTFYEDGSDLVGILSGSIDATGLTIQTGISNGSSAGGTSFVNGGNRLLAIYRDSGESTPGYQLVADANYSSGWPVGFLGSHDAGSDTITSSFIINHFNFASGGSLRLSEDSDSGEDLAARLVWNNKSFADIGTTAGSSFGYTLAGSSETVSISFSADAPPPATSAVPVPGTLLLVTAGILGGGITRRLAQPPV